MGMYPLMTSEVEFQLVGGYSASPVPSFVDRLTGMVIDDIILRCVAFLGTSADDEFRPRATCFFVSYHDGQHQFDHLVTAEHVVSGILTKGHDIWLRVNLVDGSYTELKLDASAFRFHPNNEKDPTDVAVMPINLIVRNTVTGELVRMESGTLPLNGEGSYVQSEEWHKQYAGLGSEVAIVGLFRSHYGKERNVPVLRVGTIAAKPVEPVWTKYAGYISAHLIESRSISGLSGSPVFIVPDVGTLVLFRSRDKKKTGESLDSGSIGLLGLMHGHFDVQNLNDDVVHDDERDVTNGIHTGMGVVIPLQKIIETLEHPEFVQMRKEIIANLREKGASADLALDEPAEHSTVPASDAEPNHRERFTALLNAAVKTPPQAD